MAISISIRTVSNCHPAQAQAKPAAADGAPPCKDDDVEMAGGDGVADANGAGIVDEANMTVILQEDGKPIRELVDTLKPKKKATKHVREQR